METQFAQIRAGGVSWVRIDLPWKVAEPKDGIFDWAPFDRLMTAASEEHVHVLGVLDYSTPWASSDPGSAHDQFFPPDNDADFATYGAAIAARYGSSGSFWAANPQLKPAPLAATELWNEPYGSWYWEPRPDPMAYAALVRQTAPAIHAADPRMKVLISGNLQDQTQQPWLAKVLAALPGVGALVDGLAVHPYPTVRSAGPDETDLSQRDSFGQIPVIRRRELAAGVNIPIWITEIGWSTAPGSLGGVPERTQARFISEAVKRATLVWRAYVPRVFVYGWLRSAGARGDWNSDLGLIDPSGHLTPAWKQLARLLGGSTRETDTTQP